MPLTSLESWTVYEGVAGQQLADEFYAELRSFFQKAAESPEAYSIRERDLRRVNLERFPFHFLFRIVEDRVRILVDATTGDDHRLGFNDARLFSVFKNWIERVHYPIKLIQT